MKKLLVIFSALAFFSCKHENTIGRFTLTGEIKNASDQKMFLEEIYFSQNPPAVIDTSLLEKGKVNIKSIASEEGLYRLRLEKGPGYIFKNKKNAISFTPDEKDEEYKSKTFNPPVNASPKKFTSTLVS